MGTLTIDKELRQNVDRVLSLLNQAVEERKELFRELEQARLERDKFRKLLTRASSHIATHDGHHCKLADDIYDALSTKE